MLFALFSPLVEAVQQEMWGQKDHPQGTLLRCNPQRCASSHSWEGWGVPWRHGWPGWPYCAVVPHVCVAQTESLYGCHCLQRYCAHHQQSHSQSQYPLYVLWSWKGLPYCCVLERKVSHVCSVKTVTNKTRKHVKPELTFLKLLDHFLNLFTYLITSYWTNLFTYLCTSYWTGGIVGTSANACFLALNSSFQLFFPFLSFSFKLSVYYFHFNQALHGKCHLTFFSYIIWHFELKILLESSKS